MTFQNILELFGLVLRSYPLYLLLLVPIFYGLVFFLLSFVVALMNFYYVRVVRSHIKGLDHYSSFRRIFEHFKDRRGIVDYWQLDAFVTEFFHNPKSVDFEKFEGARRDLIEQEDLERRALRDLTCELTRQHQAPQGVSGIPPRPCLQDLRHRHRCCASGHACPDFKPGNQPAE